MNGPFFQVHKEWQQKRATSLAKLGATGPVPQWKRLEPGEYENWASSSDPEVLKAAHRFCAPNASNPLIPAENAGEPGDDGVHWCDINQPYEALPERWKATNRVYAVPHSTAYAMEEGQCKASPREVPAP